jgi:transposase
MAKFTDEERTEKIIQIANYIIENNSSTRKAAEQFGISNATVSEWMNNSLKKMDNEMFLKVEEILKKNKPKTVDDIDIKKRVLEAAKLITQNYTADQIAQHFNVTINVIYEDLQTRLPRISIELYEEVKEILKKHSMNNLKNINVDVVKWNENGRFTK